MSCRDCEEFQKSNSTAFYRWETATIEVRACPQHLQEVFDALHQIEKMRALWQASLRGEDLE